jgi:hypothetical protein
MMYVEKNMCEHVVQTIFGQNYTIQVQCDMQVEGIQQHLWLRLHSHKLTQNTKATCLLCPYSR